jgi:molybdopterin converting factor subunit 1
MAGDAISVRIRLFAMQREAAGTKEIRIDLPESATVDDAWTALVARCPVLAPGRPTLRFAVNGAYADPATILADGDEVACIPPVSGGTAVEDPVRRVLEIRPDPLEPDLVGQLSGTLATDADGGVVAFVGRTRLTPGTPAPGQEAEAARHAGREVESLAYEAFEPMALTVLEQIADEIEARFGVRRVAIVHRVGDVPLGDASIVVVAVAPHREAAFAAARYAIDETKARAPIWKAEQFSDGQVWIGAPARTHAQPADGSAADGSEVPGPPF